jgi:hypothetical protein
MAHEVHHPVGCENEFLPPIKKEMLAVSSEACHMNGIRIYAPVYIRKYA